MSLWRISEVCIRENIKGSRENDEEGGYENERKKIKNKEKLEGRCAIQSNTLYRLTKGF